MNKAMDVRLAIIDKNKPKTASTNLKKSEEDIEEHSSLLIRSGSRLIEADALKKSVGGR